MGAHESRPTIAPVRVLKDNRRRSSRHALKIPATVVNETDVSQSIHVEINELSVAGVGLQSANELITGATYQLQAFDSLIPVGMRVRIVSCRAEDRGGFDIGAEVV